jgi:hypothetical protein
MKTSTTVPAHVLEKNPEPFASPAFWDWERLNRWEKFTRPVVIIGAMKQRGVYGWVMAESGLANMAAHIGDGIGYWFYLDEAEAGTPTTPAVDPEPLRKAQERIAALEAKLAQVREVVA